MAVPRMSQLRPGSAVDIVLKEDQPTGKLTTGTIADFLTRGDHPRGIKVRLSDGKIGRVQALASSSQSRSDENIPFQTRRTGNETGRGLQQDFRTEELPEEDVSLLDYVRVKPAKKSKAKRKTPDSIVDTDPPSLQVETESASLQQQMEAEFPNLDAALVAAILSDHGSPDAARSVLTGLS